MITDISPFIEFPKIARLMRPCVVTEKIDGTNGQIYIGEDGEFLVGSRSSWITPQEDNHGFARWAMDHKEELMKLGPGRHFGEWWGSGIQRSYGLTKGEKRWSLFNTSRWCLHGQEPQEGQEVLPQCCHVVPVLFSGMFSILATNDALAMLRVCGSQASPGFEKPEGIMCYHVAGNVYFKQTIDKDEQPKGRS